MNIVVLRYGGLGDILLATPLLRVLKEQHPEAAVTFVTEAANVGILKHSTFVHTSVGLDKATRSSLIASYKKGCAIRNAVGVIDLYVNLQPSLKSAAIGIGLMPRLTWSFKKDRTVQPSTGKVRHAIDDFLNVLPDGIPANADRSMEFVIDNESKKTANAKLNQLGIEVTQAILINPAGTRDINRWPTAKIANLISWIDENLSKYTPVLVGGPSDAWLEHEINEQLDNAVASLVGRLTLQELGGLMEDAAVTITGDTGPLHIAAAVNARIVCLSGAADPDRTGPSNNPKDLVVINRSLPCVPCQGRSCKRGDIACMTQMSVESVVDALERRIKAG